MFPLRNFARSNAPAEDDRRHAGGAFAALYANTVDSRVLDTGKCRNGRCDLGRGHVLALPAERVADPVDEIEKSGFVHAHEIAGAKPGVARLEYIAKDLLLGVLALGVTFEYAAGLRGVPRDLADRFAGFVDLAADAEAAGAACRLAARRRISPAPAGNATRETAGHGRPLRPCPRRYRARRCLRSQRKTR